MNLQEFKNSKYYREASQEGAEAEVGKALPHWLNRVSNFNLVEKARELWAYLTSGSVSGADKTLVIAALIYLISPIDLIPDTFPVIGWLDDLGVAAFALQFISRKLAGSVPPTFELEGETVIDVSTLPAVGRISAQSAPEDAALSDRLAQLREGASSLRVPELVASVIALEGEAASPVTQILFAGRYNTGKSTLLNAILGKSWLPTGPVPTTHAVTYIVRGAAPTLIGQDADENVLHFFGTEELLDGANSDLKLAKKLLLSIPSELLEGGLSLVDSPGLEDPDLEFSQLTLDLAPSAAMVVLVLDATVSLSRPEQEFVQSLLAEDRERKLMIVINKGDRLTSAEREEVRCDVVDQLKELQCDAPVFLISARDAAHYGSPESGPSDLRNEFEQFRGELHRTLRTQLRQERRKYLDQRIKRVENALRRVCEAHVENAEIDEKKREEAREEAKQAREEAEEGVRKAHERTDAVLIRLEQRVLAHFEIFSSDLEVTVGSQIQTLGLDELRRTDAISRTVREETQRFLETQLKEVHDELGKEVSVAIYDLETRLVGLPFALSGKATAPTIKPELVPPAILVLAFPALGLFSWAYLAIGMAFGRGAIEKLYTGILEAVGVAKLRSELIEQLGPKLREFKDGARGEISKHFEELSRIIKARFDEMAAEATRPNEVFLASPADSERLLLCRDILAKVETNEI